MAASAGTKLKPLRFVRTVLNSFMADSGLEPRLLGKQFRISNATEGSVDFELDIAKDHTNRLKIIHGGTIASLVDLGGSLAVASKGYYATGVSTDLNVTYLSSGKVGDKLHGTAVCNKIGKTLAYTTVTFFDAKRNLVARGSHTKWAPLPLSEPELEPEPVPAPVSAPEAKSQSTADVSRAGSSSASLLTPVVKVRCPSCGCQHTVCCPRGSTG